MLGQPTATNFNGCLSSWGWKEFIKTQENRSQMCEENDIRESLVLESACKLSSHNMQVYQVSRLVFEMFVSIFFQIWRNTFNILFVDFWWIRRGMSTYFLLTTNSVQKQNHDEDLLRNTKKCFSCVNSRE